jgi:hypothetical protein
MNFFKYAKYFKTAVYETIFTLRVVIVGAGGFAEFEVLRIYKSTGYLH